MIKILFVCQAFYRCIEAFHINSDIRKHLSEGKSFRIIAEEEECSSDSIKRKYRRIRDEIKEEIIECLEMNCRGGKQDECHIC